MYVHAFVHVSACIFIVHAGPEVAGTAQKQIQDREGGKWGRTPAVCGAGGK